MSRPRRLLLAFVVLLGALAGTTRASAQDLEIFQDDDFVDPALLVLDDKEHLLISARAYTGIDTDYSRRNEVFDMGIGFARVVNNVYFHKFQGHVSYTRFAVAPEGLSEIYVPGRAAPVGVNTEGVPLARLGLEGSRYIGGDGVAARIKLLWNREQMMSGAREDEYGLTVDAKVAEHDFDGGGASFGIIGGGQLIYRPTQEQNYVGLSVRAFVESDGLLITSAYGFGFERTKRDWQVGAGRFQVGFGFPALPKTRMNVVTSVLEVPSPQIASRQFKGWNTEVAAFLSVPLFSHLF